MHFAINYTHILCNLAVGRSLLAAQQHIPTVSEDSSIKKEGTDGDKHKENEEEKVTVTRVTPKQYEEQQSEQIKISVELLSSAIKALESHIDSSSSINTSNQKNGSSTDNDTDNAGKEKVEVEVNSTAATNTLIVAPALGRALGQLGLLYLHPFR